MWRSLVCVTGLVEGTDVFSDVADLVMRLIRAWSILLVTDMMESARDVSAGCANDQICRGEWTESYMS